MFVVFLGIVSLDVLVAFGFGLLLAVCRVTVTMVHCKALSSLGAVFMDS